MAQTLTEIRRILEERGLKPKHALGQNFLIDQNLVRKLVDDAGVGAGDVVLEIGPGTGTLTDELVARGCVVIACELDANLAAHLRERFAGAGNFTLIEGDCLARKKELEPRVIEAIGGRGFSLVANLPYGAGTPVMMNLMTGFPACRGMWVTIQKEVGDRMLARPETGGGDMGPLAVVAQLLGTPALVAKLGPECFWPRPEIDSVMLRWVRDDSLGIQRPREFVEFVTELFSQRRKQLGGALKRLSIDAARASEVVDPTMRAEQLTVKQFADLWKISTLR
ncbi:MAG: ribosomal RNA small subunit methyltransferase A [Planctomycetes bacterium]|nr:ribosomal RNA small subunit methyltransferase A [Planctomycetota bacterium]